MSDAQLVGNKYTLENYCFLEHDAVYAVGNVLITKFS